MQPLIERTGYELILGSTNDPQFGPVLLFGAGGTLVEVLPDRTLGLPPLMTTMARRMIEQTRIAHALQRGDFERWVAGVFRDGELARRLGKLARRDLSGELLRQALLAVVSDRYDELDSLV